MGRGRGGSCRGGCRCVGCGWVGVGWWVGVGVHPYTYLLATYPSTPTPTHPPTHPGLESIEIIQFCLKI